MILVTIVTAHSSRHQLRLDDFAAVDDLKMMVERKMHWPRAMQKLTLLRTGDVLEEGRSLAYYGMVDGDWGDIVELTHQVYAETQCVNAHVASMHPGDKERDVSPEMKAFVVQLGAGIRCATPEKAVRLARVAGGSLEDVDVKIEYEKESNVLRAKLQAPLIRFSRYRVYLVGEAFRLLRSETESRAEDAREARLRRKQRAQKEGEREERKASAPPPPESIPKYDLEEEEEELDKVSEKLRKFGMLLAGGGGDGFGARGVEEARDKRLDVAGWFGEFMSCGEPLRVLVRVPNTDAPEVLLFPKGVSRFDRFLGQILRVYNPHIRAHVQRLATDEYLRESSTAAPSTSLLSRMRESVGDASYLPPPSIEEDVVRMPLPSECHLFVERGPTLRAPLLSVHDVARLRWDDVIVVEHETYPLDVDLRELRRKIGVYDEKLLRYAAEAEEKRKRGTVVPPAPPPAKIHLKGLLAKHTAQLRRGLGASKGFQSLLSSTGEEGGESEDGKGGDGESGGRRSWRSASPLTASSSRPGSAHPSGPHTGTIPIPGRSPEARTRTYVRGEREDSMRPALRSRGSQRHTATIVADKAAAVARDRLDDRAHGSSRPSTASSRPGTARSRSRPNTASSRPRSPTYLS